MLSLDEIAALTNQVVSLAEELNKLQPDHTALENFIVTLSIFNFNYRNRGDFTRFEYERMEDTK